MVYVDDTGELVWFVPILIGVAIGAAIGGGVAAAQPNAEWQDILIGAGIGAAAGLVGGAGAAGAAALGAGAIAAGAIGGGLGGFTSGFLGGMQASGWRASGIGEALAMGAIEGAIGAATGGLIGYGSTKLGGLLAKWGAAESASLEIRAYAKSPSISSMSRFEALSRAPSLGGLEAQFTREFGGIIEETTSAFLDISIAGVLAQPLSIWQSKLFPSGTD